MIYKDNNAQYDSLTMPHNRGGYALCLNCGNTWNHHHGWGCIKFNVLTFDQLAEDKRYLTKSMKDSIKHPKKVIPDFPLDPSLSILEAGHLQDRQRKRHKAKQ